MKVFLDTTVFRADRFRTSAGFEALGELGRRGDITILIPEIVRREFLSQEEEEATKNLTQLRSALRVLRQKRFTDGDVDSRLGKVWKSFDEIRTTVVQQPEKRFKKWMKDTVAEDVPVGPSHGSRVLDKYFTGTLPFKSVRARKDFPDGFVLEALRDVRDKTADLTVISNDSGVAKAAAKLSDITVFSTLEEFVKSERVQQLLDVAQDRDHLRLVAAAIAKDLDRVTREIASDFIEQMGEQVIHSSDIPDDNGEAHINSVGDLRDLTLDPEAVVPHGKGVGVIPFSGHSESLLGYTIFKADYYCLDEDRMREISVSDWSDHYYMAEEYLDLEVRGGISIRCDQKALRAIKNKKDVASVAARAEISLDSIDELDVVPLNDPDAH